MKNAKAFEKVEDPLYVMDNDLAVDARYYIDNQLRLPLTRIFDPILGKGQTDAQVMINLLIF